MMAEDIAVWTKYLQSPLVPILKVWYDVHVGKPIELPAEASDMERRMAAGISRKRIDVIAQVGGGYWIIEVKPVADMRALGQVLTYFRLFISEYLLDGEAVPVIVCDSVDADLLDEFEELGVAVVVND